VPKSHHRAGESRHSQPSQQLRDMRAVYKGKGETAEESPGMKACRELFKDNKERFLAQLNQMEKDYQAKRVAYSQRRSVEEKARAGTPVGDEGTERLEVLIQRILTEAING
jgi:hypothetical protein